MSVAKFSVGRSGAGGANAEYITREKAAEKIAFFNLEKLEAKNKNEARTNAVAYAHTREESELARNKNGRTHYRLILSWDGKEDSEKAVEETKKFLENNLPEARAIVAVHQDTDHTHSHIWIDARQIDNKKIHLSKNEFRSFDEKWTKQFDETYGTDYAAEYKAKKEETKKWKQTKREWKNVYAGLGDDAKNYPLPTKPERAADVFDTQYWRDKEIENLGVINQKYEEVRRGANQSTAQTGNRPSERTEQFAVGTEPEFQTPDSITAGKPETSRSGNDLALRSSRGSFGEEQNDEFNSGEIQIQPINSSSIHDVYDPLAECPAGENDRQKNLEEQLYGSGLRLSSEDGGFSPRITEQKFSGIEKFRVTNIELTAAPQISITEPQIKPNNEEFVKDIIEMMRQNLEDQNKQMSLRAWSIYEKSLNAAALIPPPQTYINYVAKFNDEQENKDRKIRLEDRSKLEVMHEIAFKADQKEKQGMFDKTAEITERKVIEEKIKAHRQEIELEREMSM